MIRAAILTLALLLSGPALAHRVTVFASIEGGEVLVEAKFSNGRAPSRGEVRIEDATGAMVATLPLGEDGTARFPLDPAFAEGGLSITVRTGEDHEGYWLLTPADIAAGGGS
jgi:nickel transport protein